MTVSEAAAEKQRPPTNSIARRAQLEPLSVRAKLAWLLIAALTQLAWGSYSVVTRWLQTRAHASTFGVAALLPALSWLPTALYVFGPDVITQCTHGCSRSRPGKAANKNDIENQQGNKEQQAQQQEPMAQTRRAAIIRWLRLRLLALAVGSIVSLAAVSLVVATLFAPAFVVQLVMVLTPLLTAVASRLLLQQPAPHLLGPALAAGATGTAMVALGGWLEHRNESPSTAGSSSNRGDIISPGAMSHAATLGIGLGVSLVGALLFAGYFVALQATRRALTTPQQVMASRNAALIITIPLALAVDGTSWPWLTALSPGGWGVLLFGSLVAYGLATIGLQFATRALGAATVTQLSCLRVVAAIAGSAVLLGEVPRHGVTWAGFGIVIVSTGGWLWLTARHDAKKQQQAAVTEGQAEGGSSTAQATAGEGTAAAGVEISVLGAAAEKVADPVAVKLPN